MLLLSGFNHHFSKIFNFLLPAEWDGVSLSSVCIISQFSALTTFIYIHLIKTRACGHKKVVNSVNCHRQEGVPNPLVMQLSVSAVTYSVNNPIQHDKIKRLTERGPYKYLPFKGHHKWVTITASVVPIIYNVFFMIDSLKHQISLWRLSLKIWVLKIRYHNDLAFFIMTSEILWNSTMN